jgi:hypothetical protein
VSLLVMMAPTFVSSGAKSWAQLMLLELDQRHPKLGLHQHLVQAA